MLDNMGLVLNDPNLVLPVSTLNSATFQKCMEWCQHHIVLLANSLSNMEKQQQQVIQCKTKDNEVVAVPVDWLRQSNTFKTMSEDMGLDLDDPSLVFPVSALTTATFQKCMEWCQHHVGVPEAEFTRDPTTHEAIWFDMNEQEQQFFSIAFKELENLAIAANYLDMKSLYLYSCQALCAKLVELQGEEHHDELRQLFELLDDFTLEQRETIKKENRCIST